ncbi:MAG: O-antigen ligase family protein [bacterium]
MTARKAGAQRPRTTTNQPSLLALRLYAPIPIAAGMVLLWRGGSDAIVPSLLLGAALFPALLYGMRSARWRRTECALLALFLYLSLNTVVTSVYFYRSFVVLYPWWIGFCVYLAIKWTLPKAPDRLRAVELSIDVLAGALFISCAYGLLAIWGSADWFQPLTGAFFWKNQLGAAIIIILFPLFARARHLGTGLSRATYLALFCFFLVCFIMTRSAGALAALGVGAVYLGTRGIMLRRSETRYFLPVAAASVAVVLAIGFLHPIWLVQFGSQIQQIATGGYSTTGRLSFWTAALEIAARFPVFGAGLGNFRYLFPQFQTQFSFYADNPHSLPLQMLAETGVAGAFLFFAFFAIFVKEVLLRPVAAGAEGWMRLCLEAGWVASLFHASIDFDWTFLSLLTLFFCYSAWLEVDRAGSEPARPPRRWEPAAGLAVLVLTVIILVGEGAEGAARLWRAKARALLYENKAEGVSAALGAIRLFPPNAEQPRELALYYFVQKDPECADWAERAVQLNRFDALAEDILGNCLVLRGEWGAGAQHLERAVALDPWNSPPFYRDLVQFYLTTSPLSDWPKAEQVVDRALSIYQFDEPEEVFASRLTWRKLEMNRIIAQLHTMKATLCVARGDAECVKLHQEWASRLNR